MPGCGRLTSCSFTPTITVRTPQLDRLAARGTLFRNAYTIGADTGALCMPSRAMLMTGRTFPRIPREKGWDISPQPTLPALLRERGYRTHMTGKWHNGGAALTRAFPDSGPVLAAGMANHLQAQVVRCRDGRLEKPTALTRHSTETFTEDALNFIHSRAGDEAPFFLYLAYTAPHDPRQAPSPWRERQEASPPPLPANFLPRHPFNLGSLFERDEHLAPWPRPEEMIRLQIAHYYAMIEHVDDAIGRVFAALERVGRLANTVIVFAGDNGLALGGHGLLGKQSAYEHSLRVPMIIAGPGIVAGAEHEGLTAIHDLTPTVLELAGAPIPEGVCGRSLKPVLCDGAGPVRERMGLSVFYGNLECHALREGQWKLIRLPLLDRTQLFDLAADPHELHDLAGDEGQADRVRGMLARLAGELENNGVRRPLESERRIPAETDWDKAVQKMDRYQPEWIRRRFSQPPSR